MEGPGLGPKVAAGGPGLGPMTGAQLGPLASGGGGGAGDLCVQHWPEKSLHMRSTTSLTTSSLNCEESALAQGNGGRGLNIN